VKRLRRVIEGEEEKKEEEEGGGVIRVKGENIERGGRERSNTRSRSLGKRRVVEGYEEEKDAKRGTRKTNMVMEDGEGEEEKIEDGEGRGD
jgi:hypothetical protein